MSRLLLVEKDPFLQRTVQQLLAAEGYYCAVAGGGTEARHALQGDPFDLLILDMGQLSGEGLILLRQIRSTHHLPILMLAPRHDVVDTVAGLETGADDYLCEPFDPRELVARVRAQLRRAGEYSEPATPLQPLDLGGLLLDPACRDAFRTGVALNLTTREFDLLHLFARHPNKALAAEWIFENVWGHGAELGIQALKVYVGRLRRKIEPDTRDPQRLVNVRGFGYKLLVPIPRAG